MNPQELAELTRQLAPIAAPPEPSWLALTCIVGSLLAIIVIFLIMRWLQKKATVYQNSTPNIANIQRSWSSGEYDSRRCAYQLATLLRQQLGLKQLSSIAPQHLSHQQEEWQQIIELLNQLRYQDQTQAQLDEATFKQIQTWLTQARPC